MSNVTMMNPSTGISFKASDLRSLSCEQLIALAKNFAGQPWALNLIASAMVGPLSREERCQASFERRQCRNGMSGNGRARR